MSTISLSAAEKAEIPGARTYDLQDRWWKVGFDRSLAGLLCILAAPVILLLLLAVRLTSRGVPLYRQRRLGAGGRVFMIYKIRTMYQDSEAQGRAVWSQPGDPRVTPLGRVLRATHLDELPQLWNVLRGEMSLIGPRPERPEFAVNLERALPRYAERLRVRPGLSGLAQVLQGPDADLLTVKTKLEYDLFYIEHFGPWLDLKILLGTILHLIGVPGPVIGQTLGLPASLVPTSPSPKSAEPAPETSVSPQCPSLDIADAHRTEPIGVA